MLIQFACFWRLSIRMNGTRMKGGGMEEETMKSFISSIPSTDYWYGASLRTALNASVKSMEELSLLDGYDVGVLPLQPILNVYFTVQKQKALHLIKMARQVLDDEKITSNDPKHALSISAITEGEEILRKLLKMRKNLTLAFFQSAIEKNGKKRGVIKFIEEKILPPHVFGKTDRMWWDWLRNSLSSELPAVENIKGFWRIFTAINFLPISEAQNILCNWTQEHFHELNNTIKKGSKHGTEDYRSFGIAVNKHTLQHRSFAFMDIKRFSKFYTDLILKECMSSLNSGTKVPRQFIVDMTRCWKTLEKSAADNEVSACINYYSWEEAVTIGSYHISKEYQAIQSRVKQIRMVG